MAITFPANPAAQTPANTFSPTSTPAASTNGVTYTWSGGRWMADNTKDLDATYVNVSGDTMTGGLTVPSLNSGPLAGFRNQIINGDFRVNQRNGTRTPGVGVYGFDRWKGHAGGLEQIVEALPAGQWTLSWSGGGSGTFGGTTAASPITATVAGGDTSVVVPSAATNVQLEPGPVATPFEHRPIGVELALCQRYYLLDATYRVIAAPAGLNAGVTAQFPTTMRAVPTVGAGAGTPDDIKVSGVFWAISPGTSKTISGFSADAEL